MKSLLGLCVIVGILLLGVTQGYSFTWPKWGRCPKLNVEQNFNISNYMGTWFTQAGYNLEMTQGKGRCGSATYTYDATNKYVKVYNKQISAKTNKWESINGTAEPVDASKDEGKFTVNLYVWGFWKVTGPYWVLGTDYTFYSVVYGCENFLLFWHYSSVWLLSRPQVLNGTVVENKFYQDANATLINHGIDPSIFERVDQSNCFA